MTKFNDFTQAFDDAVTASDVEGARQILKDYVSEHSAANGKPVAESFKLTRTWMGIDHGTNRAAYTLDSPGAKQAIDEAMTDLGIAHDAFA